MTPRRISVLFSVIALASTASLPAFAERCPERVFVNGRCVPSKILRQLESMYGTRSQAGRYWYDRTSGLFGRQGQPALTQLAPNLPLPGKLRRNASNGNTGVLINGRELHQLEVAQLRRLGPVVPGRYWMDAAFNVGFEGSRRAFVNLAKLMRGNNRGRSRGARSGGNTYYGNSLTGTYAGSSGGCSYVSTGSGSVMTGNCD